MKKIYLAPVLLAAFSCSPDNDAEIQSLTTGENQQRYITIENGEKELNLYIKVLGGLETLPGERCEPIKVYGDVQSLPYMWQGEESYNDTLKVDLRNKPVNSITNFILQR